jgi:hypothetical protein
LDEALAEFTDRVLRTSVHDGPMLSRSGLVPSGGDTPPDGSEAELRRLQKTVLRLHDAIDPSTPDPALRQRIRAQLHREWSHERAGQRNSLRLPFLNRLGRLFTPAGRPALAYCLVCLAVILLATVLALLPPGALPLTGAAGRVEGGWFILGAAAVAALAAFIFYFLRRRH